MTDLTSRLPGETAETTGEGAILCPATVVIPTMNRAEVLQRMLESLAGQDTRPVEVVFVDGSDGNATRNVVSEFETGAVPGICVRYIRAERLGAAVQRNQGVAMATQPFIMFFDDDIYFETDCISRLWKAIDGDPLLGGVSAMITNQQYGRPGPVSRFMFGLMNGGISASFAGKVIGPAVNLLPEDREGLPEIIATDWLNTTCAIYRREALPSPPFDSVFTGYSLMEDLTLSLRVGKNWRLANVRTARIFHDSQPGLHKSDPAALAEMELVNRHYVMTKLLNRTRPSDYARLALWQAFGLASSFASRGGRKTFWAHVRGQARGFQRILRGGASNGR